MRVRILMTLAAVVFFSASAFAQNEEAPASSPGHQVVAYYFHGTARCSACHKIESYTEEAIRSGFPDELESGRLVWKVLNMEESENRHFISDYGLYTKSVVLSRIKDGQETDWKNLSQVWNLIRSKPDFIAYIQGETREMLEKESE